MSEREGSVVVLGEFDGMHVGHRKVVEAGRRLASRLGATVGAVILDVPRDRVLMSVDDRARHLVAAGLRCSRVLAVADPLRDAEETVDEILDTCRPTLVVKSCAGVDGALPNLADRFRARRVDVVEVERSVHVGRPVDSTAVRDLVANGDVASAASLMCSPYSIRGEVTAGRQLGRTIGFPTANVVPPAWQVCPRVGVYAATVDVDGGGTYDAAVNIGVRPTVEEAGAVLIEAHLLDFDDDLYGRTIAIRLVDAIRSEQRFDGLEALVEQLKLDVERVRRFRPSTAIRTANPTKSSPGHDAMWTGAEG